MGEGLGGAALQGALLAGQIRGGRGGRKAGQVGEFGGIWALFILLRGVKRRCWILGFFEGGFGGFVGPFWKSMCGSSL